MLGDNVLYAVVSAKEMKLVYEAMSTRLSGADHWYSCANVFRALPDSDALINFAHLTYRETAAKDGKRTHPYGWGGRN
ncbi:hypothetical protein F4861DRAFT_498103 [Xylaria intraflava]|nr:hypothetical protein F4861DRAFT_498103 [Xylaria intraflava]